MKDKKAPRVQEAEEQNQKEYNAWYTEDLKKKRRGCRLG
jgi:hypothetical protein